MLSVRARLKTVCLGHGAWGRFSAKGISNCIHGMNIFFTEQKAIPWADADMPIRELHLSRCLIWVASA